MEAIQKLKAPTKRRELRRFIGMINYYRDIWPQRSHILAPLTAITSVLVPWKWIEEHQKAVDEMKRVITRETLLAYPNFNEVFDINTDASQYQLVTCISQKWLTNCILFQKVEPGMAR